MAVAILGAGAAGSACAWALRGHVAEVVVLEMGRGAGGRAGTRRTGGHALDHGCPLLSIYESEISSPSPGITELVRDACTHGHLTPFTGTEGLVDAATGKSTVTDLVSFVGSPTMSTFARGLLAGCDVRFGTRVQRFVKQESGGWRLFDAAKRDHGVFDWLVVAGATPALSRWEAGFKEPPPLVEAAKHSPQLREIVRALGDGLDYDARHVVMLAFENASALTHLPFDVSRVVGDDTIAAVVRRGNTLALHSTAKFAANHKHTMGATQHTSRVNDVVGSTANEAEICALLIDATDRLFPGGLSSSRPDSGPHLQRWGAAFPKWRAESAVRNEFRESKCVIRPDERFAFAGDFAADDPTLSAALSSGIAAANALVENLSKRS